MQRDGELEMKENRMKKIIKDFRALEKKEQIVFFLLCSTISNFIVGIVKLVLSLTIPS